MVRLVVQLFALGMMCSASACAQRSLLQAQQSGIALLLQDAFTFWLKYGPDKQYGKLSGTSTPAGTTCC